MLRQSNNPRPEVPHKLELSGIYLDADRLGTERSRYLLDHSFDNCTHDFGFLPADLEDFFMRDNRLRWVLDEPPFELNKPQKSVNKVF